LSTWKIIVSLQCPIVGTLLVRQGHGMSHEQASAHVPDTDHAGPAGAASAAGAALVAGGAVVAAVGALVGAPGVGAADGTAGVVGTALVSDPPPPHATSAASMEVESKAVLVIE
jgi:hypothetical protein